MMALRPVLNRLTLAVLLSSFASGKCVTYTTLVTRVVVATPGSYPQGAPSSTLLLTPAAQDLGRSGISTTAYSAASTGVTVNNFTLGNPTSVVTIDVPDLPSSTVSSTSLLLANLPSSTVSSTSLILADLPSSTVSSTSLLLADLPPTTVSPTSVSTGTTKSATTPADTASPGVPSSTYVPKAQVLDVAPQNTFLRGVNIGGWLILEKWMNPDVFAGTNAADEFTLSQSVPDAASRLQHHWQSYFTESDIQRLAKTGINALRIPVGFWAYDNANTPYIQGADAFLDQAIAWARTAKMSVWVDLHGSPGSQNGFDNSGHAGSVDWQKGSNIQRSIDVLKTMVAKYGSKEYADTVVGIELVNEPISWGDNNIGVTKQFASDAYKAVKAVAENQNLMVIMHDAFEGAATWTGFPAQLNSNGHFGVDSHLYQLFTDADNSLTQAQHIAKACGWSSGLSDANKIMPTFVGEWTAATNICVNPDGSTTAGTSCQTSGCQCQSAPMDSWNENMVAQVRRFVEAQLDVFEQSSSGYFFWSFGGPGGWGFFNGIEKGIIPNPVTSRMYPGQCGSLGKRSSAGGLPCNRRVKRGQLGTSVAE